MRNTRGVCAQRLQPLVKRRRRETVQLARVRARARLDWLNLTPDKAKRVAGGFTIKRVSGFWLGSERGRARLVFERELAASVEQSVKDLPPEAVSVADAAIDANWAAKARAHIVR